MKSEKIANPKFSDLDEFTKKYGSIPVKNYFRGGKISMRRPIPGKDGGILVRLSRCVVPVNFVIVHTFEEVDGLEIAGQTQKTYNPEM